MLMRRTSKISAPQARPKNVIFEGFWRDFWNLRGTWSGGSPGVGGYPGDPGDLSPLTAKLWQLKPYGGVDLYFAD